MPASAALLAVSILSTASPQPERGGDFPWRLGRVHRYVWVESGERIGETTFRFTKPQRAAGDRYVLTTRRAIRREGKSRDSEGSLHFQKDGSPVSFRETSSFSFGSKRPFEGHQEVDVKFRDGLVTATYTNNRREAAAATREIAVEQDTFLFSSMAQEQWNLFTPRLLQGEDSRVKVFYPEFGSVLELVFTKCKEQPEADSAGKPAAHLECFEFACEAWNWRGRIWLDRDGRMVRYESGPLTITLAEDAAR